MANLVVQQYLSNDVDSNNLLLNNNNNDDTTNNDVTTLSTTSLGSKNEDKFGQIAKLISDCTYTRSEGGGKIGWIERKDELQNIVSNYVIKQLYQLKPKSGDI